FRFALPLERHSHAVTATSNRLLDSSNGSPSGELTSVVDDALTKHCPSATSMFDSGVRSLLRCSAPETMRKPSFETEKLGALPVNQRRSLSLSNPSGMLSIWLATAAKFNVTLRSIVGSMLNEALSLSGVASTTRSKLRPSS